MSLEFCHRKRLAFAAAFLSLLFCLLIVRFYEIQIVQKDKWTQIALSQHQSIHIEPFVRGCFYSNTRIKQGHPDEKQPFVVDVLKFHLMIDPDSIPSALKETMATELAKVLRLNNSHEKILLSHFEKKSRSRKVAKWLDREQRKKIELWWTGFAKKEKLPLNALFFLSDYQRSYPFGSMLGAVLHTVQEEKDPHTGQALPTGGLELLCDPYLQGKKGKRLVVHSPSHSIGEGKLLEAPENGADITLTINHYLQAVTEKELAKGVQVAGAKGGWALMMDPVSGEILALAQHPPFDPSQYRKYFNDPALQELTRVKAVSDCYEPGSIMKPITVAICLKANEELAKKGLAPLFSPTEKIATSNGFFPGRSQPLKDGRRHDFLNMELAMQKSSNIYMAKITQRLIEKMGDEWYRKALTDLFGFGKKTLIELTAENPGLVPTPGKLHPNGKLEWSTPTPYSLALGHNILVNAIQIVRAYGMIANGGHAVEPHLIQKIVKKGADGQEIVLVDNTRPKPSIQLLSPKITEPILKAMKYATKPGGTSLRGDIPGYTEAGKSGTAEKIIDGHYSKEHNIASFVGIAPAQQPRIVLLVSLDDPAVRWIPQVGKNQMGGVSAAPIFREIALQTLQYLGVAPDDPFGYSAGDPRRDSKRADWAFETEQLKNLYEKWNAP